MKRIYQRIHPVRQEHIKTVQSSFEPGRKNQIQNWCVRFCADPKPFILVVEGKPLEITRERIAAKMLLLGQEYMTTMQTNKIPKGFFRSDVLPAVVRELTGN